MPKFEVKGTFKNDGQMKPFTKTVVAPSDKLAGEFTLASIGSRHRLERKYITIDSAKAINGE
ncbi:MAG: 50S ribosomal protein L18Ae [Methanocorpusculum sp.]|jgi:large subunit ribosomal protein LX|nr:50S ribosomal protein L18Ae [Methanocorpusculum sp.]MDD2470654.1 50S ribosomal protein L18Ae [Methanocorpusculum sp.]MDD3257259.1 50S ribosomal protein L18Ae [Methanocorpusculum sp.]MDD4132989.1 50S ribosomal protein L18Ae [Methanocorpusculum sp.]